MKHRRSFVASVFNQPADVISTRQPIRANIWTTAASIAEARALKNGDNSEFWHRLAGSLRKAATL